MSKRCVKGMADMLTASRCILLIATFAGPLLLHSAAFGSETKTQGEGPSAPEQAAYTETGMASYYRVGERTASGDHADPDEMAAAHRSLPFGSKVRVTHLKSGRDVVVTIIDRGPFESGRIIDISRKAAKALGMLKQGVAKVGIKVIERGNE